MSRRPPKGTRSEGGIAALAVLWSLAILAMMGMAFAYAMRTEAVAARNGLDAARAYYQARTGINRAVALLSALPADNVMAADISGEDGDASYRVAVESEGGKIDINFIADDALRDVLRKCGAVEEEAQAVSAAVLDWRDPDDVPRPQGAEASDYSGLPEPVRPRNGRFAAVEELAYVKGVTPRLYRECLSRIFTVHGHSVQVNVNAAPAEVLAVLPGFTAEAARAIVERRQSQGPFRSPMEAFSFLAGLGVTQAAASVVTTASNSSVYTVTSRARGGGAARNVRCMVESAAPGGKKPAKILRWDDNAPPDGDSQ